MNSAKAEPTTSSVAATCSVADGAGPVGAATDAAAGAGWPVDAPSVPDVDDSLPDESASGEGRPRPDIPIPGRRGVVVASAASWLGSAVTLAAGAPPGRRGPVLAGEAVRDAWCPVAVLPTEFVLDESALSA
ncbi:hypothetical protein H7J51_15915 [Mycobacterium crocinum]|uniref:Uncharacterized protein n=1 Tax=Mycolicibacterium crocinum TaxID=388459 RepID=A0ABY3TKX4_9MYCO|nr:hypothetical protein [Mycolicibacterium crocinum]MCV7216768.1 hypothetical protein [Mycolicibacterium crocinum]ULN40042.1 hypothetical protein MI149_20380 [Mycolicibacterium crocinum]